MNAAESACSVRVACCAGCRAELPYRFFLNSRAIRAVELIDRWLGIDHRSFKIRGNDGAISIIRHDLAAGQREKTLFARKS